MSFRLRVVPEVSEHESHAASLTPEHQGRMVTLAASDGTRVRGIFKGAAPSLTPGLTVLRVDLIGHPVNLVVTHHAPVYIHPKDPT